MMTEAREERVHVVGGVDQVVRVREAAPEWRAVPARRESRAADGAQVPWLLTLLPVGSLVAAGLVLLLLSRFVPTSPPPRGPATSLSEHPDLGAPAMDTAADGEFWAMRVGPMVTR